MVYPIMAGQTVKRLRAILASGNATVRVKKTNGTAIHSSFNVSSAGETTSTGFANTDLSDGNYIQLDITAVSNAPKGLSVILEVEENL